LVSRRQAPQGDTCRGQHDNITRPRTRTAPWHSRLTPCALRRYLY
jgi:hypothetical protein